jgi:hypothetical protein
MLLWVVVTRTETVCPTCKRPIADTASAPTSSRDQRQGVSAAGGGPQLYNAQRIMPIHRAVPRPEFRSPRDTSQRKRRVRHAVLAEGADAVADVAVRQVWTRAKIAELTWTLAAMATPSMSARERNRVYVRIGVGETFAAYRVLIGAIASLGIALPDDLVRQCVSLLDAYVGHEEERELRWLIEHDLAPNAVHWYGQHPYSHRALPGRQPSAVES